MKWVNAICAVNKKWLLTIRDLPHTIVFYEDQNGKVTSDDWFPRRSTAASSVSPFVLAIRKYPRVTTFIDFPIESIETLVTNHSLYDPLLLRIRSLSLTIAAISFTNPHESGANFFMSQQGTDNVSTVYDPVRLLIQSFYRDLATQSATFESLSITKFGLGKCDQQDNYCMSYEYPVGDCYGDSLILLQHQPTTKTSSTTIPSKNHQRQGHDIRFNGLLPMSNKFFRAWAHFHCTMSIMQPTILFVLH
jgi:hypothetical protein